MTKFESCCRPISGSGLAGTREDPHQPYVLLDQTGELLAVYSTRLPSGWKSIRVTPRPAVLVCQGIETGVWMLRICRSPLAVSCMIEKPKSQLGAPASSHWYA